MTDQALIGQSSRQSGAELYEFDVVLFSLFLYPGVKNFLRLVDLLSKFPGVFAAEELLSRFEIGLGWLKRKNILHLVPEMPSNTSTTTVEFLGRAIHFDSKLMPKIQYLDVRELEHLET